MKNLKKTLDHNPKYPVQTLEKALEIIGLLSAETVEGLGITELSKKLNMGKSTVHRILDTLVAYGYVEKNPDNKYCLGWELFKLGYSVPRQRNLYNFDKKILEDLCSKYEITVNLGVRSKGEVVIISKFDPKTRLTVNMHIGEREPLYCTSLGKILISEMDKETLLKIIDVNKMHSFTPNTITNIDDLMKELEKVREQGYAIDDEEFCLGLSCISMPVRDHSKKIIAAISMSGPSVGLSFNRIMDMKKGLATAALKVSKYFGYETNRDSILAKIY